MTNTEIVKDFFKLQYEGDYATAFDKHVDPRFTFVTGSGDNDKLRAGIPWAGFQREGMQGYADLNKTLFGEFDVEEFEPRSFNDTGDKLYVEGHFRFRHKETRKIADSDFCCRMDMKDGKITGGQFYENTFGVAEARKK